MKKILLAASLVLAGILAIFWLPKQPFLSALPAQTQLQAPILLQPSNLQLGDWVFRRGTSLESDLIARYTNSRFSHIGMVVQLEPYLLVAHATTSDYPQSKDQVLLSSWDEFAASNLASDIAVARPQFLQLEQQQRIAQQVQQQAGQAFVLKSREQPHLYCTTLLAEAIASEYPEFAPQWQLVEQLFIGGYYLYPQAFVEYPQLGWIIP